MFDQFPNFLSSATKDNPLIIILDSLDQLSPLHGAWKLIWFPRQLPLHVKFIVSTLPDQEYKCFPILKVSLSGPQTKTYIKLLIHIFKQASRSKSKESKNPELRGSY